MKDAKVSNINTLRTTHDLSELIAFGKKLHSKAVCMALVRFFNLFRNGVSKTVESEDQQRSSEYSH